MKERIGDLPQNLYEELRSMCKQYDRFRAIARQSICGPNEVELIRNAEKCLTAINKCAVKASDENTAQFIVKNVCHGIPYEHLYNVPYSRSAFIAKKKKFFALLAKELHKM